MQKTAIRRDNLNLMRPADAAGSNPAQKFIKELTQAGVIAREDWDALEAKNRLELEHHGNLDRLLNRLVDYKLLTQYQAARLQSRQTSGLLIGNYRLRDRVGAGDAGVIFKAEHMQTRQVVALKVHIPAQGQDSPLLRFDTERRTISQLQHPFIVRGLDVGESNNPDPDAPVLYFYAMEYIEGLDLEAHVKAHGPFDVVHTATIAYQIADALACAHEYGLVHRDVKPANILWSDAREAKLFDFGLAMTQSRRQTQVGTILGVLEYMAPEQARDSSTVDIRADIYALGGTLFYALTGKPPFEGGSDLFEATKKKLLNPIPSVRLSRDDVPEDFARIIERMTALNPADRFQTPAEVMRAIEGFRSPSAPLSATQTFQSVANGKSATGPRVLLIGAESPERRLVADTLRPYGCACDLAAEWTSAARSLTAHAPDLVILSADDFDTDKVVAEIRRHSRTCKLLLLARFDTTLDISKLISLGVDDVLQFPLQPAQLQIRIQAVMQLKEAEDRLSQISKGSIPPPAETPASAGRGATKSSWLRRLLAGKSK